MGTAQVRVTGCAVQGGRGGRCDRQQRDGALRTSSHAMNSIAPPTLDSQTSVSIIADSVSKTGKSLKTVFRYDIGTIPSISTTRIKKSSARWQKKREKKKKRELRTTRAARGVSARTKLKVARTQSEANRRTGASISHSRPTSTAAAPAPTTPSTPSGTGCPPGSPIARRSTSASPTPGKSPTSSSAAAASRLIASEREKGQSIHTETVSASGGAHMRNR